MGGHYRGFTASSYNWFVTIDGVRWRGSVVVGATSRRVARAAVRDLVQANMPDVPREFGISLKLWRPMRVRAIARAERRRRAELR